MTKEKILESAINQYSRFNYHGATMDKIAKEVGIKPASIYFFFKNKEELFVAAFKKLLDAHFARMKAILEEVREQPVLAICQSLLTGTVAYHKSNMNMTNAYISLVTSPPVEIQHYLRGHMKTFDEWMITVFTALIRRDRPHITDQQAILLTKQFILLMDGVFWEIHLYDDQSLNEQIQHALYIMQKLLEE